jgi:predicted TIM-barrel fold metal-dependent hydrolase
MSVDRDDANMLRQLSALSRREFNMGLLAMTATLAAAINSKCQAASLAGVIDTHAHIFERGLSLSDERRYVPAYDATLSDYLRMLDANGISRGVLVQPSFLGEDNSYLVNGLRLANGRLRGIAVVSPSISREDLKALDAAGIVGIRLNLVGRQLPSLDTEPWPGLLRMIADLGWQVEIQRSARDLQFLLPALLAAGVSVVIDHFGLPDSTISVEDSGLRNITAGKNRRVWVKLSAPYRSGKEGAGEKVAQAAYPLLRDTIGLDRLIWGSDWPHTQFETSENYEKVLAFFDLLVPSESERRAILVVNPVLLFRFGG